MGRPGMSEKNRTEANEIIASNYSLDFRGGRGGGGGRGQ